MANRVINMVLVGPSRVGKSSLLATMYREIDKMKTGFELTPADETQDRLDEAYCSLSRVMQQPVSAPVDDLLRGTMDFIEHRFEVGFKNAREFDLVFHDFRGGAMMKSGSDLDTLREKVAQSHVIFNVLDSVALMEVDAVAGDRLNGHDRVHKLFSKALQAGEKYLIVFVLVKCEKYVKSPRGHDQLISRFEERHRSVLRLIDELNERNGNVGALVIPAVTLGCVEFKEIDGDGNFVFERTHKDFEPSEVDQPLRYGLSFAISHVNGNRWWWERLGRWLTGHGKAFGQALGDFCNQRNGNYKKYGNDALFGKRR
jgi:hypothetical protein